MSLREAIKDLHDSVEQSPFAKLLLSGNITEEVYGDLLYNLIPIYECLESQAIQHKLLENLEDLLRYQQIVTDYQELNPTITESKNLRPVTLEYVNYLINLSEKNPKQLLAHIYIRHFGDLFGGQIIKKKVPGSGTMYEFNNRQELISKIRSILSEYLSEEARVAMQYAIDLFEALANEHNIQ